MTLVPPASSRLLRRSRVRVAGAILAGLRRFPLDILAIVKSDLRPVGRLDYAPRRIDMAVNSPWQMYRLRSCAKEPETVAWLERELRARDTFYDIGANVGAYSLVGVRGQPTARRDHRLRTGVRDVRRAVSQHPAEPCRGAASSASHRARRRDGLDVLPLLGDDPGAALHNWHASAPGEAHAPELVLPTMSYRLDDLIAALDLPPPTLIKLDVDGPELEVLEGAEQGARRIRRCGAASWSSTCSRRLRRCRGSAGAEGVSGRVPPRARRRRGTPSRT